MAAVTRVDKMTSLSPPVQTTEFKSQELEDEDGNNTTRMNRLNVVD